LISKESLPVLEVAICSCFCRAGLTWNLGVEVQEVRATKISIGGSGVDLKEFYINRGKRSASVRRKTS
jgi:hypothetical protein